MRVPRLLLLSLLVAACEAEDATTERAAPIPIVEPGTSCADVPPAEAAAICGEALFCLDQQRCAAKQGTPCGSDVDCGTEGACFVEEGVCRYDQARECPSPFWLEAARCEDWDPADCPCWAGEVKFHETERDGRLSCGGIAGALPERVQLRQTGCHVESTDGSLVADLVSSSEVRLTVLGMPSAAGCTLLADRWIEPGEEQGDPAVRLSCSATCRIWMEQFLPLAPAAVVPSGGFVMGTPQSALPPGVTDEAPAHAVETSCFFMDAFEVSRREYQECVDAGRCEPPDYAVVGQDPRAFVRGRSGLLPIVHVPWAQAEQYCRFRHKELPTEAEWERAARGAAKAMTTYPWGEAAPDCTRGNHEGCGEVALPTTDGGGGPRLDPAPHPPGAPPPGIPPNAPIGSRGASWYGVYDLAGNVREWTRDYYVARAYEERPLDAPSRNPERTEPGPEGPLRVVRGGSYLTPPDGRALQSSAREGLDERAVALDLGFRCVRYGERAP